MSRPTRNLEENSFYHVYNRANNRRSIHLGNHTHQYFIFLLHQIKTKFNVKIYAYCLMKNHYHLMLYTENPNLDKVMKYFGERYAKFINNSTSGTGPVFTGRYKSKLIDNDKYLLQALKYIHLNPMNVKHKQVHYLDYEWSSIKDYLNENSKLIEINYFLEKFLDINDFVSFHSLGNSNEIKSFYSRMFSHK